MEWLFIFLVREFHREGPVFSTWVCTFIESISCRSLRNSSALHSRLQKVWNSYGRWNMVIAFAWLKSKMNRGVSIPRKTFKDFGQDLGRINGQEIYLRDRR